MSETAELLHHVPGRLRLRIPSAKGNRARLQAIQSSLAGMAGVTRVDANPLLGTVLILYDPGLYSEFAGALETYAGERTLFSLACKEPGTTSCISEADRSIHRALVDMNRSVQQAFGNAINLKELLPIALGIYGSLFVNKKAASAQWLNWLQFAFDSYIELHEEEPIDELGQKVDAVAAQIVQGQKTAAESLRAELAAVRAELQRLAETNKPPS